ncbi:MAG: archaellin/type IV pilin N-terminal domain-containing protein [Methanoregulaceae archaeon]|nr:MAG: flagellin [Methanolinea sp.]
MRKFVDNEEAFTGLEAAIVLIAFVVVAAVFSYVVLGAGFFTTEKSQEVVHAGVSSAATNIVVKGNVYGLADDSTKGVDTIQFDVGLASGGLPVDMNKVAMIYSDANSTPTHLKGPESAIAVASWTILDTPQKGGDNVLEYGETFTIQLQPPTGSKPIKQRTPFSVEIKPEIGASLAISRTIPPSLTNTTILY